MDIENILPIFILIVYIISIIFKNKKRERPEEGKSPDKPSGAQKWLENLMEQISGEIAPPAPGPKPEKKPAPPTVVWEKNAGADLPPPVPKTRAQRERVIRKDVHEKKAPPIEETMAPITKKRRPAGPAFSIRKLRERVIWAEILLPPVALRDKDDRLF